MADIDGMATVVMAVLAASVAAGYFTIAAVVAPRIKMPTAAGNVVLVIRTAAVAFFIGCGMTHVHILMHTVGVGAPQPIEGHEVLFHGLQAVGAWLFIAGAILRLELHVVPSPTRQQLRAAVEEQRQLADHAHKRASQDELTGLARRWRFDEELARQTAQAHRDNTTGALILLDVDDLKSVNDTFGHHAGDDVLRAIGHAIRCELRASDIAARIGGDEFAIILPNTTLQDAQAAAQRFIAALRRSPANATDPTTVSAGVAAIAGGSPIDVMRRADSALYDAKHAGGNRHAVADRRHDPIDDCDALVDV